VCQVTIRFLCISIIVFLPWNMPSIVIQKFNSLIVLCYETFFKEPLNKLYLMEKQTMQLVFPINFIRFKSCEILKKICTVWQGKQCHRNKFNFRFKESCPIKKCGKFERHFVPNTSIFRIFFLISKLNFFYSYSAFQFRDLACRVFGLFIRMCKY
jgi:hypothetical protein